LSTAGLTPAQQSTLQTINSGTAAANAASSDLGVATSLPPLGNDPASQQWRMQTLEVNRQNIASQIAVQLASTTAMATLTSVDPDAMDLAAIAGHVTTVGSNLAQLTSGVKMAAALMEDRALSDVLMEAARKLAAATTKLLSNASGAVTGQGNRADFVAAAQAIALSGSQMLKSLGEPEVPLAAQQELVELAKQVAATMTETIGQSKNVAGTPRRRSAPPHGPRFPRAAEDV
jgi:talin